MCDSIEELLGKDPLKAADFVKGPGGKQTRQMRVATAVTTGKCPQYTEVPDNDMKYWFASTGARRRDDDVRAGEHPHAGELVDGVHLGEAAAVTRRLVVLELLKGLVGEVVPVHQEQDAREPPYLSSRYDSRVIAGGAMVSDVGECREQYHKSVAGFIRSASDGQKPLWSTRDDVTLANPLGPPAKGFDQVLETIDSASAQISSG